MRVPGITPSRLALLGALSLAATVYACKKQEPANGANPPDTVAAAPAKDSVTAIQVGRHVGPDKRVTDSTTTFGAKDTMFVAVTTMGTESNAALGARWTKDADLISEMNGTVTAAGTPTVTVFHVEHTKGWPSGKYRVEIFLDGMSVGTRDLTVK